MDCSMDALTSGCGENTDVEKDGSLGAECGADIEDGTSGSESGGDDDKTSIIHL